MDHGSFLGGIWSPSAQVWRMGRQRSSFCWWIHSYIQQSQRWEEGWEWTRYWISLQRRQDWEGWILCHQGKLSMSLHASGNTMLVLICYTNYLCISFWKKNTLSFFINLIIPCAEEMVLLRDAKSYTILRRKSVTQRKWLRKYGRLILLYTYYP